MSELTDEFAALEAKVHNRMATIEAYVGAHRWYYIIAAVSATAGFLFGHFK